MTLTTSVRHGIVPSSTPSNLNPILRMSGQQRLAQSAGLRLITPAPATVGLGSNSRLRSVALARAYSSSAQSPVVAAAAAAPPGPSTPLERDSHGLLPDAMRPHQLYSAPSPGLTI
ncbi:hypothetical protein PFICI_06586 [Pestalotiopsis fici W106-1]|uniref:Uncharacterized protein n=1 Tax=Pestalotiopsis fici (strain W106-1 / CGMCC3.15140) TaxID=1229662 RepID=W3X6B4_PESFW|nr:uncharacterized protein PFICI_06586 [Pestalotiopsis fici W106-1]ETS81584.1 hypothetical protein PFICI_06586 [Pestalotiopsis fici W106-1]